ncbi:ribosomal RNA small subunit methyltransferase G [Ruminococcus sp. CAG:624]|nr:ribosomal RNA small subunit methyltransferase G [Ruminococcus sp. CAG:624]
MLPDYDFCCDLFKKYELDLPSEVYDKLEIYADFLVKYNENVNLTAITDGREIFVKHFLDSILLLKYVDIPSNSSIIDVGTGAGFPSVPMKIYCSDLKITLLDSLNKRINFLQQLCEMTQIDAEFIHGRAEDYGKESQYREKFDFSCARAVANLSVLSEYCIPFVKIGGYFLSMKGPNEIIDESNKAVELLGGKIKSDIQYSLENDTRRIIAIEKISQTPTKYPRNSSQIKKKPL